MQSFSTDSGAEGRSRGGLRQATVICLLLAVITFVVFGQTAGFQFINYDDPTYISENPVVQQGLTWKGTVWAFTYAGIGHWHPLTWWTHMIDCDLYGLRPGGHHLTNVFIQAMAAMLLFLALRELTANLWCSAFVAAVFAIHPLRTESVAWVAERKDVLSGVFFALTVLCYARYVSRPAAGRYLAVVLVFALGLLCKNTLVTVPFLLLLLDWWPLRRLNPAAAPAVGAKANPLRRLIGEKLPLFLLSAGSCVMTMRAPEEVFGPARLAFPDRIWNAIVSYGIYLRQIVFPVKLVVPYLSPPGGYALWQVSLALLLLAAVSAWAWACRKTQPWLLVGWLWYLGMLVPTIGLVQISYYSHADRYTYLPGIGLTLAVAWSVGYWSRSWPNRQALLTSLSVVTVAPLMVCAWKQTGYWKDSETLWVHTLTCSENNYPAHLNLGIVLQQEGNTDEALAQFQTALKINPDNCQAHYDLGNLLVQKGRIDEAISHYRRALQIDASVAEIHNNLGVALHRKGSLAEAGAEYQSALKLKPDFRDACYNLARMLREQGKLKEAAEYLQRASLIDPAYAPACTVLGEIYLQEGNLPLAVAQLRRAVQLLPDDPQVKSNLAWILATAPNGSTNNSDEVIELAESANQLVGGENPLVLRTLAAAYAKAGRFPEAIDTVNRALSLPATQSDPGLASQLRTQLTAYRAGHALNLPAGTNSL